MCEQCGTVFTTYEQPSLEDRPILNHQRINHPFNIGKLTISIARSFQHNKDVADFDSLYLAQTVAEQLLLEAKPLSIDDIAAATHNVLRKYDPVAALQYAAQHDLITMRRRAGRPSTAYVSPDHSDRP